MDEHNAPAEYSAMLEKAGALLPGVDFTRMRMLYAELPDYNPYKDDRQDEEAMYLAYKENDFNALLESSSRLLGKNYLYIIAHLMKAIACDKLGRTDEMKKHQFMLNGLLRSLFESGDGKSAKTAIKIIDIREEYAVFQAIGCVFSGQELIEENGRQYDRCEVRKQGGDETIYLYFDVEIPYRWLARQKDRQDSGQ